MTIFQRIGDALFQAEMVLTFTRDACASLVEQAASRRLGFEHTVTHETVDRLTGRVAELEEENADLRTLLEAAERRESDLSHGMAPESRIDVKEAV